MIIWYCFKKRPKRDLKKDQIKVEEVADKNIIIIALEIKDLLVQVHERNQPGFQSLELPDTTNFIIKALKKYFGFVHCYKALFSNK